MTRVSIPSLSMAFFLPVSFVALVLFGCSESGESNVGDSGTTPSKCAPGLEPMGPACVPIFDECKDDEVPMLGGGCKRVGVKECLDGWGLIGPPDWKCKPIGPPRTCLKGWEKVAGGWCEPILPKTKCPIGTMEKIGYSICQPIGDCGSGMWGKIKTTANTIYVDQNHTGTGGKGTKTEPYRAIGEALKNATVNDHIAVAAGTYKEDLTIDNKVILEGRCAQKVTIVGKSSSSAVKMSTLASGAVLRCVAITGAGSGLRVEGEDITVRVAVQGCEGRGIEVTPGGTLTLRDSLVSRNRYLGISLSNAKTTLERIVVRDTREQASDSEGGMGIGVGVQPGQSLPSELTVRDSLVSGNREVAIALGSSKATVERTVVRDTRGQASDKKLGRGIRAAVQKDQNQPSELTVRDSVVAGNACRHHFRGLGRLGS